MSGVIENRIVQKSILISTTIEKVWAALTEPELMKEWMLDQKLDIDIDLRLGGTISIRGTLHDKPFENKGTIVELIAERSFTYTSLSSLSRLIDKPENYSVISFSLERLGDKVQLNFRQSNFMGLASYEHSNFYWNSALMVLKEMLDCRPNVV